MDTNKTNAKEFKNELLNELISFAKDGKMIQPYRVKAYENLEILRNGKLAIPVLNDTAYNVLSDLAKETFPKIKLALLSGKAEVLKAYAKSRYNIGVTFEEYYMWWYHFLYSEVTNQLAEQGILKVPSSQITSYILLR